MHVHHDSIMYVYLVYPGICASQTVYLYVCPVLSLLAECKVHVFNTVIYIYIHVHILYMFTFSVLSFHHYLMYSMYIHTYSDKMYIYLHVPVNYIQRMSIHMYEHTCVHGLCSNIIYFSLHLFAFKVKLIMVTPGNTANMQ